VLGLDLGFQNVATADSITGPEEDQRSSAHKLFNKSKIFQLSIPTVHIASIALSPLHCRIILTICCQFLYYFIL